MSERYYAYVGVVFRNKETHRRFVNMKRTLQVKLIEEDKESKVTWEDVIKTLLDAYDRESRRETEKGKGRKEKA